MNSNKMSGNQPHNLEEGEVVIQQGYILTDSFFKYKTVKQSINWRDISSIVYDAESALPVNLGADPTRTILQNLDSIATADLT
jgi:hypothetical protein